MLHAGLQILRHKIGISPVVRRPLRIQRQGSSQRALVKWHPRDHSCPLHSANRKQRVLRILVENVVDRLHRLGMPFQHRSNSIRGLPAIQARSERPHLPALLHVLDRSRQSLIVQPTVFPGVKLHHVDRLEPQIFQTLFDVFLDIVRRVAILQRKIAAARPAAILGRNFRGHIQMLVRPADRTVALELADDLPQNLFALAVAVSPGGIKKIAAKFNCATQ